MADKEPVSRRNADATKARILEVAQIAFSELGYSHTGIREIAARAGTSSTLVLRYFGSKAGLFEAALSASLPVGTAIARSRETFATDLANALLDPANPIRPPIMLALASGDPEAAAIAARVFEEKSIADLAGWLGGDHARERAIEIAMIATGLVFYLRQLPIAAANENEQRRIESWFARIVQDLVDADESTERNDDAAG
ncbi:TetR/AcrR family transcriptional regulator [Novosphingobium aquimarinum]|uniref:TetR/AcrR family transcriptional regulator n=1 Tax=Novosphingobium aquimarinum TaxID=2682494 RepID=UPI0012EC22A5|nr:TetR/AcrR family transcriptional regulator [Novosphingobium aquimarinum]